jgi:hypothetical protein
MSEKSRWTPEEERVLRSQVSKRPNNLQEAFRRTSRLIGRSAHAVRAHWYTKMKDANVCFMTVSSSITNPNRKVVSNRTSDNTVPVKKVKWWDKLLNFLNLG